MWFILKSKHSITKPHSWKPERVPSLASKLFGIMRRAIKENIQECIIILLPVFRTQFSVGAERTTDVFAFCKHCNLWSNRSVQEVNSLSLIADHITKKRTTNRSHRQKTKRREKWENDKGKIGKEASGLLRFEHA